MGVFFSVCVQQWQAMKVDAEVYWSKRWTNTILYSILYILTTHGWHIMVLFRLGKVIYAFPIPILSHVFKIMFQLVWFLITTFYGIWLDLSNNIGKGFYIGHFGGIIIRGDFGDYCSVGQCVTVGTKGAGRSTTGPIIADNVYLGAGSKVIGDIHIGSNSIIGANAVVTKTVPKNSLAVGVPANVRELKT
jgi:serine O-acetyltransferase